MNIQKIIERKFPLDHFLPISIFGKQACTPGTEGYCQVVYYDEINPKVITAKLVYLQDSNDQGQGFINLMQEDLNFNECLIFSTLYFAQPLSLINRLMNSKVQSLENYLEYILQPTRISCFLFSVRNVTISPEGVFP